MGFLHEHIILPLGDGLRGEKVHGYLRFIRQAEAWTEKQMREFQNQKLKELIEFAAKEVPFYQDWFKTRGMNPLNIDSVEDLPKLPIVNKALMRQEGLERFSARSFPKKQRKLSRSSGSTGEPFSFYVSKDAYSMNLAAKLHTWYLAGYRLGDRYMKIANGARHGRLKQLQDRMNRCLYVPIYSINDEVLENILDQMESYKPSIVRSYPIPLFLLAQYRNSHPEYQFSPNHVMTTGSTLSLEYRKEMELAFGCDVIDSYSCEGTPNTYETPAHDGYHVTQVYGIVEVLDEKGQPVQDGVGRVVSTDFWNYAHPFVRYDTQDLVEVQQGKIVRVMGRECESLVDVNGQRYTVHNFVGFFQEDDRPTKQSVTAYQVVKRKDQSIEFRLAVNDQYNDDIEKYIVEYWEQQLQIPVKVSIVDEIPLMNNNKRLTIVDE